MERWETWKKYPPHTTTKANNIAEAVFPQFHCKGFKASASRFKISIHNRASTNMTAVENFASSMSPSASESSRVWAHVGLCRQRINCHAAAKMSRVAAPSVVANEK